MVRHLLKLTPFLLLFGALLFLYFGGLGSIPLFEPDEGRYTEIPREMLQSNDFVLPHLNGVLYFEKPPLYYWLNASSLKTFGLTEFASRFWSATFGLLGLGLTFLLGRRIGGSRAGWLSALVLCTSPLYLALAHITIIDMTLTFFFTMTLASFYLALREAEEGGRSVYWYAAFLGAALSVLSKGLIGLVLPVGIAGLFVLLARKWSPLKRAPLLPGLLLFLAVALPWHVLAAARSQDFVWFYIIREHFLRFLTNVHDRSEPAWFFVPVLAWALLPWTGLLPAAFAGFVEDLRNRAEDASLRHAKLFLWLWAGVIFLFFSASQSKLVPYILPALPPLAILIALALVRLFDGSNWLRALARPFSIFALGAALLLGILFSAVGAGLFKTLTPDWPDTIPHLTLAGLAVVLMSLLGMICAVRLDWRRFAAASALCGCALFGCVWAAAPQVQSARNAKNFAAYLRQRLRPGDLLFSYRYYPQTLAFYLERNIGLAAFQGEQEFGVSELREEVRRERYPTPAEFRERWNGASRVYCLTDRDSISWLNKDKIEPRYLLMQEGMLLLFTNRPPPQGPSVVSPTTGWAKVLSRKPREM